jgi:hypothetical protein
MYKIPIYLLILFCFCMAENDLSIYTHDKKDKICDLLLSQKVPEHFFRMISWKNGTEFKAQNIMALFEHIRMDSGYVLDYKYMSGNNGYPILYARKEICKCFCFQAACLDSKGNGEHKRFRSSENKNIYLGHINSDGSKNAFIELSILNTIGNQFYLIWHAAYNDWDIITLHSEIDSIYKRLISGENKNVVSDSFLDETKQINLTPIVAVLEDKVIVRIHVFTSWGGLFLRTYTYAKKQPHWLLSMTDTLEVKYSCQIKF